MSIRLGIPRSKNQWILAMMGAAVTIGCAVPLAQGVRSLSWPQVDGFITHNRNMPGYRTMGVDIGYTYATGGKSYTGDRFRFQFVLSARKMVGRDVQSIPGTIPRRRACQNSVLPTVYLWLEERQTRKRAA